MSSGGHTYIHFLHLKQNAALLPSEKQKALHIIMQDPLESPRDHVCMAPVLATGRSPLRR